MMRPNHNRRRGSTALLAMLFLLLFSTLAFAMFSMSTLNTASASNLSDVSRARSAAETGLRWISYRFFKMAGPKTTVGNITASVADSLWPSISSSIQADFGNMLTSSERTLTINGKTIATKAIKSDADNTSFKLVIQQHPLVAGDPLDQRYIRVTSTGFYKQAQRSAYIDFLIDKKIKFAVVGKVEIQLGRNTLVQGPIAMATPAKYPPVLTLSDFQHFDPSLKTKIVNYETFLKGTHTDSNGQVVPNHAGYDGRIKMGTAEASYAATKGYADTNGDNYIDEYDIFLKQYDQNNDQRISQAEFTNPSTGLLYDANLFTAIDSAGGPMFAGDTSRAGLNDGFIDNSDAYAKVQGQMVFATSASGWSSNLASSGQTINDQIGGPVVDNDPTQIPVEFDTPSNDIMDLTPANFDECVENYHDQVQVSGNDPSTLTSAPAQGSTVTGKTIDGSHGNSTSVTEHTPFGSTSYQATYKRPVYKNVTFKNCVIKKGTNALFDGCTFQGVTFVNMTHDIIANHAASGTIITDKTAGMTWSQNMISGSFSSTTTLTSANSKGFNDGNNIRFNNCTFNGPLVGTDATAYTHFTNSWEFTGSTMFDNQVDETATIVCPNTNIEMGSFTDPNAAPSTLKGVVVTGNIDIRGTSTVDGSIIVTGDGAGNTTLGYFGPDDGSTNPSAMPEGGYGRLNIRYNPYRALPDGINIAIDISPQVDTYTEQ